MINTLFIATLILLLVLLFRWAFRALPEERWQILGVIPAGKQPDGFWKGINITFYGFFSATAYLSATALVYLLMGAIAVPAGLTTVIFVVVCSACVPAARVLAHVIEKKAHTASVGAASFVGILLAPWAIWAVKALSGLWSDAPLAVLPALAAVMTAYAFGEGIGRLACISFGCCYGKPLYELPGFLQRIVGLRPLVFRGSTKKIVYADHLEGVETFPVQALTAVLYCAAGVMGIHFFLDGQYRAAYLSTLVITQVWRFLSEFLRADYRGNLPISVYQIMALLAVPYGYLIAALFPSGHPTAANLLQGFTIFGNPLLLVFLQFIWIAMLWHSGRSKTTGATLQFHVHHDRI